MPDRLQGVLTPPIVPLHDDGEINEAEFRRYIDWLIARGAHGIYANGSTSEFTRFTPEERRRIVRMVCEQAGGRVPVVAGAGEANVRETLAACAAYKESSARAVAVVSPFYFKLGQEAIYAYFKEIADNSPIDITLYNIPAFASPMELKTICRLAELPRVIGIKDSSGDLSFMMRLIAAIRPVRPEFSLLTGAEAILMPMLLMGADGGTHSIAGVIPDVMRKLYELTRAGRLDEARTLQFKVLGLLDAMLHHVEFPEGFRAGVEIRGFEFGRGRQPVSKSQPVDREKIKQLLQAILIGVE